MFHKHLTRLQVASLGFDRYSDQQQTLDSHFFHFFCNTCGCLPQGIRFINHIQPVEINLEEVKFESFLLVQVALVKAFLLPFGFSCLWYPILRLSCRSSFTVVYLCYWFSLRSPLTLWVLRWSSFFKVHLNVYARSGVYSLYSLITCLVRLISTRFSWACTTSFKHIMHRLPIIEFDMSLLGILLSFFLILFSLHSLWVLRWSCLDHNCVVLM